MKRTIPLWITAVTGFVLIAAHFSPYTESWGEVTMIWFDVLASIAFILGGGNLLKLHLKKISDRAAGWAYSAITILSFLVMLYVGMVKWGVAPAPQQEFFGETFAPLPLEEFPFTYSVEGVIPTRADGAPLPPSVVRQIAQQGGKIAFRGWMTDHQRMDLKAYKENLGWQQAVDRLHDAAQPPARLRGKSAYYADHEALAFAGHMTDTDFSALAGLDDRDAWTRAVDELRERSGKVAQVQVPLVPPGFDAGRAAAISPALGFDPETKTLSIRGPMSLSERDALAAIWAAGTPAETGASARAALLAGLTDRGPLSAPQREFVDKMPGVASPEQKKGLALALIKAGPLNEAQQDMLLADYRRQLTWRQSVGELFAAAHTAKFPWSGEYNAQGSPFWWLYEYAMKPLTATMFAMLAFYVASAAFRAFRAKNLEATLLLATAFIILLGRTFAGTVATGWLPPVLSGLRIDSLTVTIMTVFNTAGNRAIAIGIALGIASTSLKVLLGIDRSYLGSAEE
jgi:hypothetical protein